MRVYTVLGLQFTRRVACFLIMGEGHFLRLWNFLQGSKNWELQRKLQSLSASLYVSKRGAYWDRLCRDVVGRWLVGCHARALWPNGAS